MKLWILERKLDLPHDDNPWRFPYDKNHGFVIRAETEDSARKIANSRSADEGDVWANDKYSTCIELISSGEEGIILIDFNAA